MNLVSLFSETVKSTNEIVTPSDISWDEASQLIDLYNRHPEKIQVPSDGQLKILHGFSIDKERLLPIINQVESTKIFIALGYHDGIIRPDQPAGFSTIYFGMDDDYNLHKEDEPHTIVNYCDPCPKKCPVNVDLDNPRLK